MAQTLRNNTDPPTFRTVVALFGPTGIGKTSVAIELAKLLRPLGEDPVAVSADALQVYAGLEILTAAPTSPETKQLEHRLVSFKDLGETFSAGEYSRLAHQTIDDLLTEGRRPIVVGGTGLYLRAALADLDLLPPSPPESRQYWQAELEEHGAADLHRRLTDRDPGVAEFIPPTDSQRIVRAHELLDSGRTPTRATANSELWASNTRHPTLLIGLVMEREALGARINERVEEMVSSGVVDEVHRAAELGPSVTARKALGFEQLLENDVEAMKLRTRQYAKRQLTWMRKLPNVHTIDVTDRDPSSVATEVFQLLSEIEKTA